MWWLIESSCAAVVFTGWFLTTLDDDPLDDEAMS